MTRLWRHDARNNIVLLLLGERDGALQRKYFEVTRQGTVHADNRNKTDYIFMHYQLLHICIVI